MLDIKDFHGQNAPKEELEEIQLLSPGGYQSGTITLNDGVWADFIELEMLLGATDGAFISYGVGKLLAEDIQANPTDWQIRASWTNGANAYAARISATSATTATISIQGNAPTQAVKSFVGKKKRYATKNLSRTISVNGGNNIDVNSRYEVVLPSEFYESDGSIKKGVQVRAEIYYSGANYTGWAEPPKNDLFQNVGGTNIGVGVSSTIADDKIFVDTGGYGAASVGTSNILRGNYPDVWGATLEVTSVPCRVIATLNDAYILSVEPAQGSFERIVNEGADVLEFTNNGDYAYVPLSDMDFDGDIFEYNATTRFLSPKKSGKHIPSVFSHAEDGAGQARVKYVLVQADTAQGDNPVVVSGVFTKQYTSDGGTQSIHTPLDLDESKWYALYAENFTSGNVTYTTLVSPTSEPGLGDITDYAFIFSLERG